VTMVEAPLRVIRGSTVLRGAEGVRLRAGDILESASAGFVQIEFLAGTVTALGPSTRVLLLRTGGKGGEPTQLVLLSGWLKGETGADSGAYCYASPLLAATTRGGTVLLHASGDAAAIFLESGSAHISKVNPDGRLAQAEATGGTFFSRRTGRSMVSNSRPDEAFLNGMPRPFRDTLPSRLSRFPKPVAAARDHEVSYAEIQAWLTMPATWRRGFVERFQPRLRDAEFRKEVEAHAKDHPEWNAVLHPDNEPQTAPTAEDSQPARRR